MLRANQGAVHETIDQLLTMTTDTEGQSEGVGNQLVPHGGSGGGGASSELPPSYALSATPPPSYHQAVPSPHRSPLLVPSNLTAYICCKNIVYFFKLIEQMTHELHFDSFDQLITYSTLNCKLKMIFHFQIEQS